MGYSPWGCKRVGHDLATKQQQHNDFNIHFTFKIKRTIPLSLFFFIANVSFSMIIHCRFLSHVQI